MKYIIFDSGPIISLAINGLLEIIEKLKNNFKGEFIITPEVKREIIDKPLQTKRYELEGIRIRDLLNRGILKLSSDFIKNNILERETDKIMRITNSSMRAEREINLIQKGEASCLAFSLICNCENVIVVDERTTRLLFENPDALKERMETKLHIKLKLNKQNIQKFKEFRFLRSSELVYLAYKKGFINLKSDKVLLDALLYSLKFSGTTISEREIEEMKRIA